MHTFIELQYSNEQLYLTKYSLKLLINTLYITTKKISFAGILFKWLVLKVNQNPHSNELLLVNYQDSEVYRAGLLCTSHLCTHRFWFTNTNKLTRNSSSFIVILYHVGNILHIFFYF